MSPFPFCLEHKIRAFSASVSVGIMQLFTSFYFPSTLQASFKFDINNGELSRHTYVICQSLLTSKLWLFILMQMLVICCHDICNIFQSSLLNDISLISFPSLYSSDILLQFWFILLKIFNRCNWYGCQKS